MRFVVETSFLAKAGQVHSGAPYRTIGWSQSQPVLDTAHRPVPSLSPSPVACVNRSLSTDQCLVYAPMASHPFLDSDTLYWRLFPPYYHVLSYSLTVSITTLPRYMHRRIRTFLTSYLADPVFYTFLHSVLPALFHTFLFARSLFQNSI